MGNLNTQMQTEQQIVKSPPKNAKGDFEKQEALKAHLLENQLEGAQKSKGFFRQNTAINRNPNVFWNSLILPVKHFMDSEIYNQLLPRFTESFLVYRWTQD